LIQAKRNSDTAQQYAAVMAEYRKHAEQHPHDPLVLLPGGPGAFRQGHPAEYALPRTGPGRGAGFCVARSTARRHLRSG
jgi:hypothetical protein